MSIQVASGIYWYICYISETPEKYYLAHFLLRWCFRSRNHPVKDAKDGSISEVHGRESGVDLSMWFSRWASHPACAPCSQMFGPMTAEEETSGVLLFPWDPQLPGPDPLRLLLASSGGDAAGAGFALLAAVCLSYSSELCPSPLLLCRASASGLCWVFNYPHVQMLCKTACRAWAGWTQ